MRAIAAGNRNPVIPTRLGTRNVAPVALYGRGHHRGRGRSRIPCAALPPAVNWGALARILIQTGGFRVYMVSIREVERCMALQQAKGSIGPTVCVVIRLPGTARIARRRRP